MEEYEANIEVTIEIIFRIKDQVNQLMRWFLVFHYQAVALDKKVCLLQNRKNSIQTVT